MFYEIYVYKLKTNKEKEFEELIKEVGVFHRPCSGVKILNILKEHIGKKILKQQKK